MANIANFPDRGYSLVPIDWCKSPSVLIWVGRACYNPDEKTLITITFNWMNTNMQESLFSCVYINHSWLKWALSRLVESFTSFYVKGREYGVIPFFTKLNLHFWSGLLAQRALSAAPLSPEVRNWNWGSNTLWNVLKCYYVEIETQWPILFWASNQEKPVLYSWIWLKLVRFIVFFYFVFTLDLQTINSSMKYLCRL